MDPPKRGHGSGYFFGKNRIVLLSTDKLLPEMHFLKGRQEAKLAWRPKQSLSEISQKGSLKSGHGASKVVKSVSVRGKSIPTVLRELFSPAKILTLDFGMPKLLASNAQTALLALPLSGGACTRRPRRLLASIVTSPSILLCREFGETLIYNFDVSPVTNHVIKKNYTMSGIRT